MNIYAYHERLNELAIRSRSAVRARLHLYKIELLLLLGAAIFVYLPFMAEQLNNADDFMMGVNYHPQDYGWENAQGDSCSGGWMSGEEAWFFLP